MRPVALFGLALLSCAPAATAQTKRPSAGPAVGRAAPEIEGVDLDGKKFKLSDYRGKVVVLDFWGNW